MDTLKHFEKEKEKEKKKHFEKEIESESLTRYNVRPDNIMCGNNQAPINDAVEKPLLL